MNQEVTTEGEMWGLGESDTSSVHDADSVGGGGSQPGCLESL